MSSVVVVSCGEDNVGKFFCGAQHNAAYDDVGDSVATRHGYTADFTATLIPCCIVLLWSLKYRTPPCFSLADCIIEDGIWFEHTAFV